MRSPYAVRRPVENVYLVRERDRRLAKELLAVAATVLLLGGGLLTYTWIHTEITQIGYEINRLEKELHRLEQQERRLELEKAERSHPSRLEQRARGELGMGPPTIGQTVFYEELTP